MAKTVLICGSSGQLGSALLDVFSGEEYVVYGTYNTVAQKTKSSNSTIVKLEITDEQSVTDLVQKINPDIIINTCAMTHVDNCELHPQEAYKINVEGNRNLLKACSPSTLFVFISTYYVFDGHKGWYEEGDAENPLSYYGTTKLLAEKETLQHARSLIIRTSKIFSLGRDTRNFAARLYDSLAKGQEVMQVDDQFTNPILADDLARIIKELIFKDKTGIYNAGGWAYVDNFTFAVEFARYFGFDASLVKAKATEQVNQAAPRPRQCGVRIQKLLNEGIRPLNLMESFSAMKELKAEQIRKEIVASITAYHSLAFGKNRFISGETSIPVSGKVFDEKELQNLVDAALDGWWTEGRFSREFCRKLSEFLNVRYVIPTNSGSSANLLAFSALTSPVWGGKQITPGSEIITVAAGFPTTINPIIQNNCTPVFVDIELGTYNIDTAVLESAITEKTKAVFIALTLGNPFNITKVKALCEKYNLWLVEDCCDALGSRHNGQLVSTFGDLATFSFYPAHHITAGEGGAVVTNNPLLKKLIESYRDWGRDCWCATGKDNTCGKRFCWKLGTLPEGYDHKYIYSRAGYNLKWTDLQAAIALAQLDKLPDFIIKRKRNFALLQAGLQKYSAYLILPKPTENSDPAWFGFPITIKPESGINRKDLVAFLEQHQISTRLMFAGNITKQPYFKDINYKVVGTLQNSDIIMTNTFWIGVYPGITEEMIAYIVSTFDRFFNSRV